MKQMSNADKVRQFMTAMGQPVDLKPTDGDARSGKPELILPFELIAEEYEEVFKASTCEEVVKELGDLLYVTYFALNTFGWDADVLFARIHESNMSKLVDGKPVKREDGKILKGPNYRPPVVVDLVAA